MIDAYSGQKDDGHHHGYGHKRPYSDHHKENSSPRRRKAQKIYDISLEDPPTDGKFIFKTFFTFLVLIIFVKSLFLLCHALTNEND